MMEWFYQIPGVDELRSAESFFQFFAVPYHPSCLAAAPACAGNVSSQTPAPRCRCKTGSRITIARPGLLARRLLAESYQLQFQESGT